MPERAKVIAFDVDPDSLASLRQAFPDCEVEAVTGATPAGSGTTFVAVLPRYDIDDFIG
jgi:hypothetical protein